LAAVELQSTNDRMLPLRMAEYALRIYRLYEVFPKQYVLYVGNEEMKMSSELVGPNFYCRYKLIDIRELDEESLLNSPFDSDNIMAILTNHRNRRQTIQRILQRIATLEGARRDEALKKLLILSGLRKLGDEIRAEVKYMPILDDIMDHDLLGPIFRDGEKQGELKGQLKGELTIVRRLLAKRFGPLPTWLDERLTRLSSAELEELSLRLLDAKNIDELFSR
jgi:predicted transposase YdaD